MVRSTKWRLILSCIVAIWGLSQAFPYKDCPFDRYLVDKASAHTEEFKTLVTRAQALVTDKKEGNLLLALSHVCSAEKIDLCKFFPKLNVEDIKNLDKRNRIVLQYLFQSSKSVFKQGLDLKGGVAFVLEINPRVLLGKENWERQQLIQKAIEVIMGRIDSLGVAEPIVRPRGDNAVEVQLPGISLESNPDVVQALKKPAKLEFRLVNDDVDAKGDVPHGYERLWLAQEDANGQEIQLPVLVKRVPELTGQAVKAARPVVDSYGRYEISLQMTDVGTERFGKVTQANLHKRLAIVLDGKLYSAPVIQSAIMNGQASISGNFTQREAIELSNVLNNPLGFELDLVEVYEVGPSLAANAKSLAIEAAFLGTLIVIALLVYCYRTLGVISALALFFNGALVIGAWAAIGATITLPSITALALTFGMAVDSNILILERVREEIKAGKDSVVAMHLGHQKAFLTILDANLTTLLTAFLLIWLGTGSVKGFGITLAIGILTTLFSVLVFSRALMEIYVRRFHGVLAIKSYLNACSVDFLKYKRVALTISLTALLVGWIALGCRGKKILGIDFVGGDELLVKYEQVVDCQAIRSLVAQAGLGEVNAVYQRYLGKSNTVLKIQAERDKGPSVLKLLDEKFPDAHLKLLAKNTMGGSVSADLQRSALWSVLAALCGILLYVALRFEFGYGVGAIVALSHDILITIGLYVLCGRQFSGPMVAAILTVIGYSINDTIIIFDRIREELPRNAHLSLVQVINLAINKTLSRTLMTSITTFIPAFTLFLLCPGIVSDYALVFLIGIVVGTFSSIFIASPIFYAWHHGDRKHVEARRDVLPTYAWKQE